MAINWNLGFLGNEHLLLYRVLNLFRTFEPPENYLEVGVKDGDSLLSILHPGLRRVVLSDIWTDNSGGSGRGSHDHISLLLENYLWECEFTFLDGDSKETIPRFLREQNGSFDLVLIDGDHGLPECAADIDNCAPSVRVGGHIIIDDILLSTNYPLLDTVVTAFLDSTDSYRMVYRSEIHEGVAVLQRCK